MATIQEELKEIRQEVQDVSDVLTNEFLDLSKDSEDFKSIMKTILTSQSTIINGISKLHENQEKNMESINFTRQFILENCTPAKHKIITDVKECEPASLPDNFDKDSEYEDDIDESESDGEEEDDEDDHWVFVGSATILGILFFMISYLVVNRQV